MDKNIWIGLGIVALGIYLGKTSADSGKRLGIIDDVRDKMK